MKAAFIRRTGPAESIEIGELPTPEPGPDQVRVRVACAALNPVDTYIRSGAVAMDLPLPFVVGCDFAGTVESVGGSVKGLKPGTRVWGSNQGLLGRQGTFAEYVVADADLVYPTPDDVSDEQAAATALVGITAHLGLVREANLQPGETIFVNGGSGGVGSMVTQMATAMGARVVATAGSEENLKACRRYGAEVAINYRADDVATRTREACPDGVNVWWETTRAPDFSTIIELLSDRGRMVVMAGREAKPELPVGPFYVKECRLLGFVMFKAPPAEQQKAAEAINGWLAAGKLETPIGARFNLDDAGKAHKLQEDNTLHQAGTLQGKIVVEV